MKSIINHKVNCNIDFEYLCMPIQILNPDTLETYISSLLMLLPNSLIDSSILTPGASQETLSYRHRCHISRSYHSAIEALSHRHRCHISRAYHSVIVVSYCHVQFVSACLLATLSVYRRPAKLGRVKPGRFTRKTR